MEMTIDKSISQIIDSLMGKKSYLLDHSDRVALTNALNTMRKYQKITKIAKAHKNGATGLACMNEICEVLEDGN